MKSAEKATKDTDSDGVIDSGASAVRRFGAIENYRLVH